MRGEARQGTHVLLERALLADPSDWVDPQTDPHDSARALVTKRSQMRVELRQRTLLGRRTEYRGRLPDLSQPRRALVQSGARLDEESIQLLSALRMTGMTVIDELLRATRARSDSTVLPPAGVPTLTPNLRLPPDLLEFYEKASGVQLFRHSVC
jgi:hypothetical protein